jgi:hypothetical protein
MHVRTQLLSEIERNFKALPQSVTEPLISEDLISPFRIGLSKNVLGQAQAFVQACFQLRQQSNYINKYTDQLQQKSLIDPGNKSILMSYDFHMTAEGVAAPAMPTHGRLPVQMAPLEPCSSA